MLENIFLGLQPYTEADAYRFKGRTEESQELFRLIIRNDYTVCYAESGEGKTSLLNAGVFPLLRQNMFFPIAITFTSDDYKHTPDNFDAIIDRCIKDSIADYNEKNKGINIDYKLCTTDFQDIDHQSTLQQELSTYSWWKLRNYKPQAMGLMFTPVFVFDQFEEVFNLPGSIVWTKRFFDWLEDVSSDSCPEEIVQKVRSIIGDKAAFPVIKEEKDFKAVFSLRKEYIGELDYWGMQKCFIPGLKDNRYCLKALTYEGAKKVMIQQQRFEKNKVKQVLDYFVQKYSCEPGKTIAENLPVIPALLLSVICDSWEKNINYFSDIDANDIDNSLNKILENFYDEAINSVVNEVVKRNPQSGSPDFVSNDIETALFDLVDVNGKRVRTKAITTLGTIRLAQAGNLCGEELRIVKYKKVLSDHRIIKISKVDGEDYVEIVHDALCPIISKRKEQYLASETKKREEEKLREQAKMNKKRIRLLLAVIFIACNVIGIVLYNMYQVKVANKRVSLANWNMMENQSRAVAEKASMLVEEGDFYTARLLAIEALPQNLEHPDRPYTVEAEAALRKASMYDSIVLRGHNNPVVDAVFRPNGEDLISCSSEGIIKIWNIFQKTCYKELKGHLDCVCTLSCSSDGKLVASASNDKTVKIWNVGTGKCMKTLYGHKSNVYCTSFSPDDQKVVSCSKDKTIKIWDSNTGECLKTLNGHDSSVNTAFFNSRGNRIVSSSNEKINIWDAISGNCIYTIYKEKGYFIDYASFSPNGDEIAYIVRGATSGYYHIIIQTIGSEERTLTLKGHVDFIRSITYSHNGKYIVSASRDKTVKIWDSKSGLCLRTIPQSCEVNNAHFSPDDSQIVVSLMDNTICLWDFDQTSSFQTVGKHNGSVTYAKYSPNGKYIISSSFDDNNVINVWDASTGKLLKVLRGHSDLVLSASFSFDGQLIASGSRDNNVRIWNVSNSKCIKTIEGHTGCVYDVDFSPDKQIVASASYDKTIRIWNVNTGECLKILDDHDGFIYDVDFSPDGKYLVSASQDEKIKIWEVCSWKCLKTFEGHTAWVRDVDFSPNGKYIASASGDHTIRIWNIENGECSKVLVSHKLGVKSVDFSHNGDYLISASVDETIRLWDIYTEKCVQTLIDGMGELSTVHFSPSGRQIIAPSNKTINVWEFIPLQELIDTTRKILKNRTLTPEERRKYYLE